MFWIALSLPPEDDRRAWCWWALRFTPRVASVEEALLLEASTSVRLFGGRKELLRLLLQHPEHLHAPVWGCGATSLVALAALRCKLRGERPPAPLPDGFPLDALTAARPHAAILERTGITRWGQLRGLPRPGVARRFGAALLTALDAAYGDKPERYPWQVLPEVFDEGVELPVLATSAPELGCAAEHLLRLLQAWLQGRNRGLLAFELEWTLDLRRLDGIELPPRERLTVRTAQPTQSVAHLRRLLGEHLDRMALSAPANHLRLRSLETVPWAPASHSLLPQERAEGERLHELVERLSVRLGEESIVLPQARQDHRPECKQAWLPARSHQPTPAAEADALYPTWLLPQPLPLQMQGETPCFGGPLRRLARLYRVETAWWEEQGSSLRDYFIARSPQAGLGWIYRERPGSMSESGRFRWYLQGLYA